jgi:internalin A
MTKRPAMEQTQIPPFIKALNQQLGQQQLQPIHANTPAHWARPLSYTINDAGQVIALNLKGAGLTQLPSTQDWQHLQRLDISGNAFTELVFAIDLPQLELLEASYNTVPLEKLVLDGAFAQLRYLYVYKAGLVEIIFKKGLPQLLAAPDLNINLHENNLKDDRLRGILDIEDQEQQRKELISYFKALTKESVAIKRVKLIFLGNTEAGKTTLYDILKNDTKATKGSTHGINQFSYDVEDIQVAGFDFGGQDYYHSTHAPFFSNNALYILVWGNGQADNFDKNKAGDHIFPLNYWLGSVQYFDRDKEDKKSIGSNPEKMAPDHLSKKDVLPEAIANSATMTEEPPTTITLVNTNKKLHLLQNISSIDRKVIPLNNRDIQTAYSFADSNGHFCFTQPDQKEKIAAWINEKIIAFAQSNTVPKVDEDVETLFAKHPKVLFNLDELTKTPEVNGLSPEECTYLAKRLHRNLSCYYLDESDLKPTVYAAPSNKEKEVSDAAEALDDNDTRAKVYDPLTNEEKRILSSNIIIDLATFTDWVYAILSEQLTKNGYFTLAAAKAALKKAGEKREAPLKHYQEAINNLPFILAFMLHHKIIFRVANKEKYIAPNYLPETPDKAAELLLSTFEPALVKYSFTGFFHNNIITEMLARFFDHLLVNKDGDSSSWKYLLWKNKVLLYEKYERAVATDGNVDVPSPEAQAAHSKKLLYIHFEFPDPANKDSEPLPTISIHRFVKNYVSDLFLKQVMGFIQKQIASYQPQKWVITPSLEYIPYNKVIEEIKQDGQNSNLVYYNSKIYRKGDFNLFLDEADRSPMKKIFISYSKKDLPMVNQFQLHLAPLERSGLIAKWYCTELMAGSDWDATIQAHFDAADIICFMVSPHFNATDYIYDYELKKAFERKNKKGANPLKIVPIIMKHCIWSLPGQYNLGQYTALPYTAKPVADFHDPDMAWLIVAEGIRILCQHYDAVEPTGDEYYKDLAFFNRGTLGKQLLGFFERIVQGKVDNNA